MKFLRKILILILSISFITGNTVIADAKEDIKVKTSLNNVQITMDTIREYENIKVKYYLKNKDNKYNKIKTTSAKSFRKISVKKDIGKDLKRGKTYKVKVSGVKYNIQYNRHKELPRLSIKTDPLNMLAPKTKKKKPNIFNQGVKFNPQTINESKIFYIPTLKEELVKRALSYKNDIYSQSRREEKGYNDCSSYVYNVYNDIGINLGEYLGNTETELKWCEENALKVKLNKAKPGDIIFYSYPKVSTFESYYKHVTHVALFLKPNLISEMSDVGINYRTRSVSKEDEDCIAVYRPIHTKADLKDKDNNPQNIKKTKEEIKKEKLEKVRKKKKSITDQNIKKHNKKQAHKKDAKNKRTTLIIVN